MNRPYAHILPVPSRHHCTDRCRCPVHGVALWYSKTQGDHCCPDAGCVHANGMRAAELVAERARAGKGVR